jgi:hypothetical protein
MSATEARNAALRGFGGVSQMRKKYHEMSGLKAVEFLAQDLRYSLSHVETQSRICRHYHSAADDRIVTSQLRPLFARMCGHPFYLCRFGLRLSKYSKECWVPNRFGETPVRLRKK